MWCHVHPSSATGAAEWSKGHVQASGTELSKQQRLLLMRADLQANLSTAAWLERRNSSHEAGSGARCGSGGGGTADWSKRLSKMQLTVHNACQLSTWLSFLLVIHVLQPIAPFPLIVL